VIIYMYICFLKCMVNLLASVKNNVDTGEIIQGNFFILNQIYNYVYVINLIRQKIGVHIHL